MISCVRGLVSAPSPPEVIEEPTNSVPTVGEFGSLKSAFRSAAQLLCTSPVITIGLATRRSAMKSKILLREPRYPSQASMENFLPVLLPRSLWAKKTCWARTFQREGERLRPSKSHLSCASPVIERLGSFCSGLGGWTPPPAA